MNQLRKSQNKKTKKKTAWFGDISIPVPYEVLIGSFEVLTFRLHITLLLGLLVLWPCSVRVNHMLSYDNLIIYIVKSLEQENFLTICCDLSSCIATVIPVGICVILTALFVVFTDWPPHPPAL